MTPRNPPHPNSYAVPDSPVFAGEYPFALHPPAALDKLRHFLDAGITVFIDLTAEGELEPYERVLRGEAARRGVEVEYRRLPIPDMGVPSRERMAEILDAIDDACRRGRTVYVHCWGGVGRTGTVVGCHLVRRGMRGDEALRRVAALFATMSPDKRRAHPRGSPQVEAQREFVRRWREGAVPNDENGDAAVRDRVRGALVGLAAGDAVGTAVEFRPAGTFPPVTDMTGGGPFGLRPGQWTDDTAMALCLAESLIERGGMDARDQMERYVRWWRDGHLSSTGRCFDIGNTTAAALRRFVDAGDPIAGSTDPRSAGNGSIMRLAPVAMLHHRRHEAGIAACGESSRTTHGARVAVDACRYLGGLLLGAFAGAAKEELLSPFYTPVPRYWDEHPLAPEIAEIAAGSFARKQPPAIRGTGYAAASLEAALWAFAGSGDFREGCLRAVNLGDDADTTAAVYGQIAGAFYGERAIPESWRARLALPDVIDAYAERLYALGAGSAG